MKLLFYDYSPANRRNWRLLLGGEAGECQNLNNLPNGPGVLVAHVGQESAIQSLSQSLAEKQMWAVVVSGGGYTHTLDRDRVYFRRCKVQGGLGATDQYFQQCFEDFWNDLKDQARKGEQIRPQFSLLDPTGVPEQLLAWTLVHHVTPLKEMVAFEMDKVERDYNKLRGALKSSSKSEWVPSEWNQLDDTQKLTASKELIKLARADV